MTPDNGKHVIYLNGKHSVEVYACTVSNALKLVESAVADIPDLAAVSEKVATARAGNGPGVCRADSVVQALKEVATAEEGSLMRNLRRLCYGGVPRGSADERPEVLMRNEWRHEWAIWCIDNQVHPDRPSDVITKLSRNNLLEAFSFFAPARDRFPNGYILVDDFYLDGALELEVLRRNQWKDGVSEAQVVSRFVRFLNSWGNGRWDLLRIQDLG